MPSATSGVIINSLTWLMLVTSVAMGELVVCQKCDKGEKKYRCFPIRARPGEIRVTFAALDFEDYIEE